MFSGQQSCIPMMFEDSFPNNNQPIRDLRQDFNCCSRITGEFPRSKFDECLILTDGVRPISSQIELNQGYKISSYRSKETNKEEKMIQAAVSAPILIDVFIDLITLTAKSTAGGNENILDVFDVILESWHNMPSAQDHIDLLRGSIELPVFTSYLYQYADLVLNDGCIAVCAKLNCENNNKWCEIQITDNKIIHYYANDLRLAAKILQSYGIIYDPQLLLITEGSHVHISSYEYEDKFQQLAIEMGTHESLEKMDTDGDDDSCSYS
jgi:hypothetical protein